MKQVNGIYAWPYDGPPDLARTALVVIDMQRDFLEADGWFALTGGKLELLVSIVEPVVRTLDVARKLGLFVVFTAEGHRPDLSDLSDRKRWQSRMLGHEIGTAGPLGRHLVIGQGGTEVVAAAAPRQGEPIVHKPGKSAFIGTDFDQLLRRRGIRNLIFCGITTDGAVQCTMRDANDRGYECLILSDATASDDRKHHEDQIQTLSLSEGLYGSIAKLDDLVRALIPEMVS